MNVARKDLPQNLAKARQVFAIATAFALPLSTTGQNITVAIFAVLALMTLDIARFGKILRKPEGYLPVALFALILIGTLWSVLPFGMAIKSISPYAKLLLIPLVIATDFTPRQALQIGYGFLAACAIVLAFSLAALLWPSGPWHWFKYSGVPVKDYAVQSGCFALCAFGLTIGTVRTALQRNSRAVTMALLAVLFFADIFLIVLSKTGIIMTGSLLVLLIVHIRNWRLALAIAIPAVLVVAISLWASGPAQMRLSEMSRDMNARDISGETLSTASRTDFWTKAIGFAKEAPLLGHGTGSILPLYQSLEATNPSPYGAATSDPHNQFLHVVLQVGLLGGLVLLAMWAAHFRMFLHRDVLSIMGQAVVLQNFVGSLFNSHLSTVTQGMLYCLAVGVLGSLARDQLAAKPSSGS